MYVQLCKQIMLHKLVQEIHTKPKSMEVEIWPQFVKILVRLNFSILPQIVITS